MTLRKNNSLIKKKKEEKLSFKNIYIHISTREYIGVESRERKCGSVIFFFKCIVSDTSRSNQHPIRKTNSLN